jgi:hypothetical protein
VWIVYIRVVSFSSLCKVYESDRLCIWNEDFEGRAKVVTH